MTNNVIKIGQSASFSKTISESDVYGFAGITGDFNTVHIDAEMAEKGIFGQRVAHGMMVASLISTVIGTKLPGPGTIYMEQDCKFLSPVYFGDTVTATVSIVDILNKEKGIYKLSTIVVKQDNTNVIEGYAVVKYK